MTNMVILTIIASMRTVNISDLKAQLSAHIQLVRDGEEVLVCDCNKTVARSNPVVWRIAPKNTPHQCGLRLEAHLQAALASELATDPR